MTKTELFLDLAKPDENGVSRKVCENEFAEKYQWLKSTNGYNWIRQISFLQKNYNVVIERKNGTTNGKILSIQLNGYKNK